MEHTNWQALWYCRYHLWEKMSCGVCERFIAEVPGVLERGYAIWNGITYISEKYPLTCTRMALWAHTYVCVRDPLWPAERGGKAWVWFTDELALYVGTAALPSRVALNDSSERKPCQWEELWASHLVTHFLCWKEKRPEVRIHMDL